MTRSAKSYQRGRPRMALARLLLDDHLPVPVWDQFYALLAAAGKAPGYAPDPDPGGHRTPWVWFPAEGGRKEDLDDTLRDAWDDPACRLPNKVFSRLGRVPPFAEEGSLWKDAEGGFPPTPSRAFVAYYRTRESAEVNLLMAWLLAGRPRRLSP